MHSDRSTHWLLAGTLALLVACQPKTVPMTPEETQRVAKFTERMTTRCVGRYLIDLPQKFVLNSQSVAEIEGVKVTVQPMEKSMFEDSLATHRARLERERIDGEATLSLTEVRQLPNGSGLAFNRSRTGTSAVLRAWEVVGWINGYKLVATIDSRDMSKARTMLKDDTRRTDVEEKFRHLMDVYSRLRGRTEFEVPKDQGFCIANGFVAGPPSEQEEAYVSFHLDGAPDVYFDVGANPEKLKEKERLLERGSQVEREMTSSGTQTIRKGMVEHGGIPFDEWLFKGPTPDRVPGTMFTLVGNEASPGVSHPFIRLELLNGFRIPAPERSMEESAQLKTLQRATLSEAEALAIWDKVTPTLRLRPGAI